MNNWEILGIEPTVDLKIIKKAYASKLRLYHPEDDPKGFQNLREAYDNALRESKYIKEVKNSHTYINEETVSRMDEQDELINIKFDNEIIEESKEIEFDERKLPTNDEELVDIFMSRVNEIYKDFFKRIDVNAWKRLLQDQTFWILSIRESLCNSMFEFLMDKYYLPHDVWCTLNEYFSWTESEGELYKRFDEKFVNYVFQQIRNTYNLRYEFFDKDYKCNYDEFIALRNIAYYALMDNRLEEFRKAVMSAKEIFPNDPDLVRMLGVYYLRIKDLNNAEIAFTHLIKISPKEIDGYLNRGYIFIRQARVNKAYHDFQNALNIDSYNISALKGFAECYFYFDNLIEAKLLYSQISEACIFDVDSRLRIVEINIKLIDKYKNQLTSDPKNIDILYKLAKINFEMENFEECSKVVKELINNQEENSDVYLLLGRALAGMNKRKESIEYFNKAFKSALVEGKNAYEVLFYRGEVNLELNNYEAAINDFKATLRINKYNAEALINMSKVYILMEKYSKALELSNKAINIDSSRWIYYSVRGAANFSLKSYEKSRDDYVVVLKHDDSLSIVWYRKGFCHLQLSEYEDAIKCFKKAIDWNVKVYEDVHLFLALAYFKVEKFKNALDEVKLHCANNPRDNIGRILMGDVYRALGNMLKAEEEYVKAYKLKPNNYKVLKLLINFCLNKNELERAFEYLKKMLESNIKDEKLCVYFLWLCVELNELVTGEVAFIEYEKLLKYNINSKVNPYALYYYGVILYKKGFSEAMYRASAEKLEKAIELGLKNGDLFSYLSMIYYELGDKDNSIKYAKEALIMEPDNIEYKIRYKGILKYIEKRNLFIFKVRPIAKNKWPIKRHLEHKSVEMNLPVLNIEIGENYEEDV